MRRRMHHSLPSVGKWLGHVVKGYFNYHAVPTNIRALRTFRDEIVRRWRRTLCRRSDKGDIPRNRMKKLADDWLLQPHILHPWPNRRFAVRHPRWEPYAGKAARPDLCGGCSAMSIPTATERVACCSAWAKPVPDLIGDRPARHAHAQTTRQTILPTLRANPPY